MYSLALVPLLAAAVRGQVTATGTQGVTNPPAATMGTPVNQTSMARLLSVNSVDDWCLFAPPSTGDTIGDTEAIEVAWCTKPRNNARVIPDGTIYAAHFVTTDFYVQVSAIGDFTNVNLKAGDYGGELDPHGATGAGNPVGGNVTSNVTGEDVSYQEWMSYISDTMFCIRVCTNENSTYSAAAMCEHKLDEMGCTFVMPGDYSNGTFDSCEADVAYPPGWYPIVEGGSTSYSVFAQYFTGAYTQDGTLVGYTVGTTATPTAPFTVPSSSSCTPVSTISNGIASLAVGNAPSSGSKSSSNSKATAGSQNASGSNTDGASGARRVALFHSDAPIVGLGVAAGVVIMSAAVIFL